MADYYSVLGISEDATPEQIQEAYEKKRVELIASNENDQERQEAIEELQRAYTVIGKKNSLALIDEEIIQRKINPLLGMVDKLNDPLHNEFNNYATALCLFCGAKNPKETLICTTCGRQISRPCPKCGRVLRINAKVCPRCNTIIRDYDQSRLTDSEHLKEIKEIEREENQIRVIAFEEHHKKRRAYGLVFWLVVGLVLVSLCAFTFFLNAILGLSR